MHGVGILLVSALALAAHATSHSSLPTVGLGYEIHRAISYNETAGTYNFTNIPYAEPPLGSLRFRAPIPPQGIKSTIQDGSIGKICPQMSPNWTNIAVQFATSWTTGQLPFNFTEAEMIANNTPLPPVDPRTTEDCLVLDVIVPKAVFETKSRGKKAPVVVWIYGGGYEDGSDGIIWVAMNYRLGVFGFLAGPSLQADGTANAGLHDQRLALQWVQEHIAKFGGDPDNVTIMGESAGAGSIMYHLLAQGGQRPALFQRAIAQSVPLSTIVDPAQQESNFQKFLSILNVTSLEEARQLPSSVLIAANVQQIGGAPYNQFAFNPSVDGDFIPGPPAKLLLQGSFAQGISLLSSHTSFEGALFADPRVIVNETALAQKLRDLYPLISDQGLRYVLKTLYPPTYDGSYPYKSDLDRIILMLNELYFAAAQQSLFQATVHHGAEAYAYEFSIAPALHASAHAIAGFAKNGVSDAGPLGLVSFPRYGKEARSVNLNLDSSVIIPDPSWNNRTKWWAKAPWA
ncbi:hypothetical protein TARUN_1203 [Trichoderma arundinaceum]|uniref:Carboxylic ester hydrolase n=1 Tax=Trichoderma arundinaceum TaxID=490622 RepID=A0A395NY38_TRIAR|nr:hypothetical protein TARUN_1203 [Trichoderma arundinaceum]